MPVADVVAAAVLDEEAAADAAEAEVVVNIITNHVP